MFRRGFLTLLILILPVVSHAAELIIDYDVSKGSWDSDALELSDAQSFAPNMALAQTVTDGLPNDQEGQCPLELVSDPATKFKYLSFKKPSGLWPVGITVGFGYECLNDGAVAKGYTMEGMIRLHDDFEYFGNPGALLGGGGHTLFENTFLCQTPDGGFTSATCIVPPGFSLEEEIDKDKAASKGTVVIKVAPDLIKTGNWVHVVKTHDASAGLIAFYVDGKLVAEVDASHLQKDGFYPGADEFHNLTGRRFIDPPGLVSGLDIAFYRVYRGAMPEDEIQKIAKTALAATTKK